jgi:hypothetical protein
MINTIEQLPELSFTVQNDRPDLVAASVEDDALHLDFAKEQSGVANITVRATAISGEGFIEDAFVVTIEEWGDLDGDGDVDLADAVVALRVEAGMHPELDSPPGLREDYASSGADVDGNGQVEISETLYILQKVSGLKP